MRKTIIACLILLVVIITLAVRYFSDLSAKDNNASGVLKYIPNDVALIFSFKNDKSFYEIFENYNLINGIIGPRRSADLNHLKNFMLGTSSIAEITADKNIFVSMFHNADSIDFVYGINLDPDYNEAEIEELLHLGKNVSMEPLHNRIYKISNDSLDIPLYILINKGSALASFSKPLLERCAGNEKRMLDSRFIDDIQKTLNKKLTSPLSLFINHKSTLPFINNFLKRPNSKRLLFKDLGGYSLLTMNFASDALMFNGLAETDSTSRNYLNLLLNQKPVTLTLQNVVPLNSSNFTLYAFSDLKAFHTRLQSFFEKTGQLRELKNSISKISNSTGIDPDRDILPLFNNEIICIENENGQKYAVIKVKNGRSMSFNLQLISSAAGDRIGRLSHDNLFYYLFGDPLTDFKKPYFGMADNYLVIANSPGLISSFFESYETEKFLSASENYKKYNQLVGNQSNVFFFASYIKSRQLIKTALKPSFSKTFNSEAYDSNNFFGFTYQWSAEGDHFFTNLYLGYNSSDTTALIGKRSP